MPYFHSCVCSCYPTTKNCQNKETDFGVQLCSILASLRKTGRRKEEREKKRGGQQGKREEQHLFFAWEGTWRRQPQCFTINLKKSKSSAPSRVLCTDLGCWAPAVPTADTESRSLPRSGSSFLDHGPSHSLKHPASWEIHQLSSTGVSKPLPHQHHTQTLTYATPRGGHHTDTVENVSQQFHPDTQVKHSSNREAVVLGTQCWETHRKSINLPPSGTKPR